MAPELSLIFPDPAQVQVALIVNGKTSLSPPQPFSPPLDAKTRGELTWYLETYPVHYTTEIDDVRAARIAARLKDWGAELFNAAFASQPARRLYESFRDAKQPGRLLTVTATHPTVLAQPWELLCDPEATYLFREAPPISIRRRPPDDGRRHFAPAAKATARLLFVVSRPDDAGFIDPRGDPTAVMDALDAEAPGRVAVEFLRPPTLAALVRRLDDDRLPPIDILHFDGHGAFDADGRLADAGRAAKIPSGAEHLLREAPKQAANQGYLLLEDDAHKSAFVSAEIFGDLMQSKQIGLVILSACQSAMAGGEDSLGSVAPRLIRAGVPAVLAMTQSVLVATTRALSHHFYRELAAGRAIGAALDSARSRLFFDPKRGERRRASGAVALRLQDWFVPALYQADADGAPLTPEAGVAAVGAPIDNLEKPQESGFFGRRRELWDLERWFVDGARRIVITGFGGQGKTALATEAGRWLGRARLFSRVCFVGYAGFQGADAVAAAVSALASVLGVNLIDASAAAAALRATPTLLILDNLESLDTAARAELLTAARAELLTAAALWSEAGGSRVLVTTRPDADAFAHPDYPTVGSKSCRYLALGGLAPADALDWFQALWSLTPAPSVAMPGADAVAELFAQVGNHPLSIGVLTQLLKQQRIADVGEALRARLAIEHDPLRASLDLSIARLDAEARAALPGLGIFIDGALDTILMHVLELDAARWAMLRDGLRETGLVALEPIPGSDATFVRFHPTLAPAMRDRLTPERLAALGDRRRDGYHALSAELYQADTQHPESARAIARRELPNLLASVVEALDCGEVYAAEFAANVELFLSHFGRASDSAALRARAARAAGEPGSWTWFHTQSNIGEQLYRQSKFAAAEAIFDEVLRRLDAAPSHDRAVTQGRLARCLTGRGILDGAESLLRKALRDLATLPTGTETRGLESTLRSDLANVVRDRGDLTGAESEYLNAIEISREVGDQIGVAVGNGQLGTIYLLRRQFARAAFHHRDAIATFERLGEPRQVATGYHQLGLTLDEGEDFAGAEQAYRKSGEIRECVGDRVGAARAWQNLANDLQKQGRVVEDIEPWYRKALAVFDEEDMQVEKSATLNNLAALLQAHPARLGDARASAMQALAIKQTIDPAAAEIWITYAILSKIADKQGDAGDARDYRAGARDFRRRPDRSRNRAPASIADRRGAARLARPGDPARARTGAGTRRGRPPGQVRGRAARRPRRPTRRSRAL